MIVCPVFMEAGLGIGRRGRASWRELIVGIKQSKGGFEMDWPGQDRWLWKGRCEIDAPEVPSEGD